MVRAMLVAMAVASVASAQFNPGPVTSPGQIGVRGWFSTGELPLEVHMDVAGMDDSLDVDCDSGVAVGEIGLWEGVSFFAGGGYLSADTDDFGASTGLWLVGARGAVSIFDGWSVGCTVQVSGWEADDKVQVEGLSATANLDMVEVYIAPGVTWSCDKLSVYAGPYFLMADGDVDLGVTDGELYAHTSFEAEEDESVGGFVGVQWEPLEDLSLTAEFRSIGETVVFGIAKVF